MADWGGAYRHPDSYSQTGHRDSDIVQKLGSPLNVDIPSTEWVFFCTFDTIHFDVAVEGVLTSVNERRFTVKSGRNIFFFK